MIHAYIGPPGSGKTYSLTKRVLDEKLKHPERPVFTNYPLRGAVYFEFEDLLFLPPGLVVIDEAHLLFSQRAAMRLPAEYLQEMSQTRKRGWDVLWSTQHERRVDSVLKDITELFWLCSAWGGGENSPPAFFRVRSYEPEKFRKKGEHIDSTWSRFSPRVAGAYDTLGRVQAAKHLRTVTTDAITGLLTTTEDS